MTPPSRGPIPLCFPHWAGTCAAQALLRGGRGESWQLEGKSGLVQPLELPLPATKWHAGPPAILHVGRGGSPLTPPIDLIAPVKDLAPRPVGNRAKVFHGASEGGHVA